MLTPSQVIALLERNDKWSLGGGRASVYAPVFPRWLDTPGFWDEAYFADIRLDRLYCLLALDDNARPLTLRRALRRWTPDRLLHIYTVEGHPALRVQEERVVTASDTLACRLTLTNAGLAPVRLHLMLWSLPPASSAADVQQDMDAFSFAHTVQDNSNSVFVALGGSRLPDSWTVNLADVADTSPLWQTSLFGEKFQNLTLPREMQDRKQENADVGANELLHLALHYVIEADPGGTDTLTVGASLALDRDTALVQLRDDMTRDVVQDSRAGWERYFASVPSWECDDPYLENAYWYRWYGLRLMIVDANAGCLPYSCVFAGAGNLRSLDADAAQSHIRETGWMRDKSLAYGSLLNFLDNQTRQEEDANDGSLPGRLFLGQQSQAANIVEWGRAALQLFYLTNDVDSVRQTYPGLARYAEYCDREWDKEQSGLYDSGESDQDEQKAVNRFLPVDADDRSLSQQKGVASTCAMYELQSTLAQFARALNNGDADWWQDKADATRTTVRAMMWDAQDALFKDVDALSQTHSPRKTAEGFYPFASDIATSRHLDALRHLQDPRVFGTPYPVPFLSLDDPDFDAQGIVKGRRSNDTRNGRVLPRVNSRVVDALAHAARTLDPALRPLAADLLERMIRMMFHDGDPKRPNSHEHYNPLTGMPCLWRGIDDHQHSCIVDLIIRHVAGVQPAPGADGSLVIDPLPFGLRRFRLEGVPIRGHLVDVLWSRETGYVVRVDGREAVLKPDIERVEIPL